VEQASTHYRKLIASLEVSRLKFVDESWGQSGADAAVRVIGAVPHNHGQHVTLLGAMSLAGVGAVMTVKGTTDAEVFRAYIKHVLGPPWSRGDIVMLDNLSLHKGRGIQQMLARRRIRLRYLPSYSPDFAAIELNCSAWYIKISSSGWPGMNPMTSLIESLRVGWYRFNPPSNARLSI
jgi:transposase